MTAASTVQFSGGIGALPVLLVDRNALFRGERVNCRLETGKGPLDGIPKIPVQLLLSLGQMLSGDLNFGLGTHKTMVGIWTATVCGAQ